MRQPPLTALLLVLAAAAGCSKHATEPAPVTPPASAVLVATQPVARSTNALYDGEIWGQFDRDLDPETVSDKSAFLKLDGQRIACVVAYESITRRVTLKPKNILLLQRTYTVEFSPAITTLAGVPLPPGVFFQFTTNTLRRLAYDFPRAGALEGPVVTLGWGGTQGPVNDLFYEVYASEDSFAVEQRTIPYLERSVFTRFLPSTAWRRAAKVYWAVTSENALTRERMNGPTQSFRVVGEGHPVQVATVRAADHGSNDTRQRTLQFCSNAALPSGPNYNAAIHWGYPPIPVGAIVVGATASIVALDTYTNFYSSTRPTLWMAQNEWAACTITAPGPPYPELTGLLSNSAALDAIRVQFTAPRLAAFVEAKHRRYSFIHGMLLRTNENIHYHSPFSPDGTKQPTIEVRYVIPPPGAER